jgi:response regulator NasT
VAFQSDPYSVLLVSASEKLNTAVLPLLPGSDFWPVTAVSSLSRAKRLLVQQSYDIVIVNAPLPDGMGTDFAMKLCGETDAAIALLIRHDLYEEANAKALPAGVVAVSKPMNSQLLLQVIRGLCAMRERLRAVRDRQATVEEKIEEIRLVNRAKWLLIEREGQTEPEAHRLITREAMDSHRTKRAVAQEILHKYE